MIIILTYTHYRKKASQRREKKVGKRKIDKTEGYFILKLIRLIILEGSGGVFLYYPYFSKRI